MTNEEAQLKFMQTTVDRVNNLNERVIFLEETITKIVNILGKTNIKSMHEADNDTR